MISKLPFPFLAAALLFAPACAKKQTVKPPVQVAQDQPPPALSGPGKTKEVDEQTAANHDRRGTDGDDNAVYFDFDSALLRDDARRVLQSFAAQIRTDHARHVRVEGNCDETGTTEYNIALGETRAKAAKKYLQALGVAPGRIKTVSYGKERPKYPGMDEASLAKNRRDDLVLVR